MESIEKHLAANEREQRECNPMIHRSYIGLELCAKRPTDDGHKRLEDAEEQSYDDGMPHVELLHAQALAQRHGKGIHSKPHAY